MNGVIFVTLPNIKKNDSFVSTCLCSQSHRTQFAIYNSLIFRCTGKFIVLWLDVCEKNEGMSDKNRDIGEWFCMERRLSAQK